MQSSHILIMGNSRLLYLAASVVVMTESIVLMSSGIVAESLVTIVLALLINDGCVLSFRHLSFNQLSMIKS